MKYNVTPQSPSFCSLLLKPKEKILWRSKTHLHPILDMCKYISPQTQPKKINFQISLLKVELHSNYIFLHFALIGLEWDSITLFTKNELFFLPKLTIQHHLHKIYMAFYLLTWTYFNDLNGRRNILINSQLKRILMSSDKKKWNETERQEKTWKKKITAMKVRLQWKWDTRFKFFEAFWIWTKNKHRIY